MRRILIPIDGSEHSAKALRYIAERRKDGEKSEVFVLNVQPDMPTSRFVSRGAIRQHQESESEKAFAMPKVRALQRLLKADAYTEIGPAAETIVKFAKKTGCHEIVMSARGLGNLKGLLLGSVTTKVIHLSTLPVTVVK